MENVVLGRLLLLTPSEPEVAAGALRVRNALEPLVAADAARHSDAGDVHDLEALVARMSERRDEPAAFLQANWALHRRLTSIVGNPVLADVYRATLGLAEARVTGVVAMAGFGAEVEDTLAVHRELVAAIGAGEAAAVVDAAARHAPAVETAGPDGGA
jgi:DNA-binding FadR family transcriptional regulator